MSSVPICNPLPSAAYLGIYYFVYVINNNIINLFIYTVSQKLLETNLKIKRFFYSKIGYRGVQLVR